MRETNKLGRARGPGRAEQEGKIRVQLMPGARPAFLDQDDDGIVVLTSDRVSAGEEKAVRNAVRMCPSGALRIVSDIV